MIWGIGLRASNPKAQGPRKWRGRNLLGFVLTDVRERLASESQLDRARSAITKQQSLRVAVCRPEVPLVVFYLVQEPVELIAFR